MSYWKANIVTACTYHLVRLLLQFCDFQNMPKRTTNKKCVFEHTCWEVMYQLCRFYWVIVIHTLHSSKVTVMKKYVASKTRWCSQLYDVWRWKKPWKKQTKENQDRWIYLSLFIRHPCALYTAMSSIKKISSLLHLLFAWYSSLPIPISIPWEILEIYHYKTGTFFYLLALNMDNFSVNGEDELLKS